MTVINLILIVEDPLGEAVANALLEQTGKNYQIKNRLFLGKSEIRANINALNESSKGFPHFVLTDQNSAHDCPPTEISKWIKGPKNPNLIYRFAVMEVESWVMAHRKAFTKFLSVPLNRVPLHTDKIKHPKEFLIGLARKSRSVRLREDIVPPPGATSKTGPDYNGRLGEFVRQDWNAQAACKHSPSLERTFRRLREFG